MRKALLILAITGVLLGALFVAPVQALSAPVTAHLTLSRAPALGLDTSQRPTLAGYQAMHAAGYAFLGRYLAIPGGSKIYPVTVAELANARAAGVSVFLIFEWCSRSHLPNSYAAGARDAKLAQTALAALGLPLETPVYYSLDRTPRALASAVAYFQGIGSVVPVSAVGCYGSKAQLAAVAGLISYPWHAVWMDHLAPLPFYQSTHLVKRGGCWCDQNWSYGGIGVVP